MERQDFINQLRSALAGAVPQDRIDENVTYYNDYIDMMQKKGRTAEEVIEELGNPRLLAKTITEAWKIEHPEAASSGFASSKESGAYSNRHNTGADTAYEHQNSGNAAFKILNMPRWLQIVILVAVVIVVLFILASLVSIFVYLFVPIMVLCAIVWGIRYLIRAFKS